MVARCVSLWIRYGLKQGISWLFCLSLFILFFVFLFMKIIKVSCLGTYCVSSWSSYGLKQGIPWNFFLFVYIIFCLPVHEKYKHSLVWAHVVSARGAPTALNSESLGIFLFLFVYIIFCLPVHEKHKHYLFW